MNIFEFAMKMEKDGENYYRELAQGTEDKGLKNILNMLADDEVKHYKIFDEMKKNEKPEMAQTQVLSNAKNLFSAMKKEKATLNHDMPQIELYEKAQEVERKSQDFYEQKSKEFDDPYHKELFLRIAEEEKRHYFLLENIIQYIARPQQWVENAEFHHLDEY